MATYVTQDRQYIGGIIRAVDLTSTADNTLNINTSGATYFLGGSMSGSSFMVINTTGLSSGTFTAGALFTGTSRSGTQISATLDLTSSTKWFAFLSAAGGIAPIARTTQTMYYSCSSTTAVASSKTNIYCYVWKKI